MMLKSPLKELLIKTVQEDFKRKGPIYKGLMNIQCASCPLEVARAAAKGD